MRRTRRTASAVAKKKPQRKKAERPRRARPRGKDGTSKMQALIHELQVHAEEISVQNEQLRKAQHELEEARDRFADLYDFAPIGYVSVDTRGFISEINMAGAQLLGKRRKGLITMPLSAFIAKAQYDAMDDFLMRARARARARDGAEDGGGSQTVEVAPRGEPDRLLHFIARPGFLGDSEQLFLAMVDVTEERRLENNNRQALAREQEVAAERALEIIERTAAESRVKALLERLVTAQEEERRRIARNLHDHLGQQLTALRLTLDSISRDQSMPARLNGRLEQIQDIVSKMDRDVDLLAWDLRPVSLDESGLPAALSDLVRQWTSVSQVPAEFHQTTPAGFRLADETESNIYRIVQEALNNIAKHAGATHVSVLLEHRGHDAAVIIEDNGRGFDPETAFTSRDRRSMMGLLGMRERAALIDGDVQFESAPGRGTTVFVRVPISRGE